MPILKQDTAGHEVNTSFKTKTTESREPQEHREKHRSDTEVRGHGAAADTLSTEESHGKLWSWTIWAHGTASPMNWEDF